MCLWCLGVWSESHYVARLTGFMFVAPRFALIVFFCAILIWSDHNYAASEQSIEFCSVPRVLIPALLISPNCYTHFSSSKVVLLNPGLFIFAF